MNINETTIIIVLAVCITHLLTIWNKRQVSSTRRLLRIIFKLRKENSELRSAADEAYKEWFKDFSQRQKTQDEVLNKLYDLTHTDK